MGVHMPAKLMIGGKVPRRLFKQFMAVLGATGASLEDYNSEMFLKLPIESADDLLSLIEGDALGDPALTGVLVLCHDATRDGRFADAEGWLESSRIDFDRHNQEEQVTFRGRRLLKGFEISVETRLVDCDGNLTVQADRVDEVLDLLLGGRAIAAVDLLKQLLGKHVPPLKPLQFTEG